MSSPNTAPCYRGFVFERMPPTPDFSCSREVALPGKHTRDGAWRAVYAALRAPGGRRYIGGDVRPA